MSTTVGRIEVAGRTYQTSRVYDGLDDQDKERVQNILARHPEMTLQQAITQMNDEQALKRSRNKREETQKDAAKEEKSEAAKTNRMSQNAQQQARQQEQRRTQEKTKKTRESLSMGQMEKVRAMMEKNKGMTLEQAIQKLGLKGKIS
jgi:hypothetical protein